MKVIAPRFPELPPGQEWTGRPLLVSEGDYFSRSYTKRLVAGTSLAIFGRSRRVESNGLRFFR